MKKVKKLFKLHYERSDSMTGYELSKNWFDFAFENTDIVTPTHTALMMWIIEKWNRLGQIAKFGLPASEAMNAIGVKHHSTYKKAYADLVKWGFVSVITESKNQYSANIIALSKNSRAHSKALARHLARHLSEQQQGTCDITKPRTKNQELVIAEIIFLEAECQFNEETKSKWLELCELRKWKKKEPSTLKSSLKKLMRFEEAFAAELIDNAIAGNYQGVVFPDTQEKYEKWKRQQTVSPQYTPTANDQW